MRIKRAIEFASILEMKHLIGPGDLGFVVKPRIIWKGCGQTRDSFAISQFKRG